MGRRETIHDVNYSIKRTSRCARRGREEVMRIGIRETEEWFVERGNGEKIRKIEKIGRTH
jgi:hypothetical protein